MNIWDYSNIRLYSYYLLFMLHIIWMTSFHRYLSFEHSLHKIGWLESKLMSLFPGPATPSPFLLFRLWCSQGDRLWGRERGELRWGARISRLGTAAGHRIPFIKSRVEWKFKLCQAIDKNFINSAPNSQFENDNRYTHFIKCSILSSRDSVELHPTCL